MYACTLVYAHDFVCVCVCARARAQYKWFVEHMETVDRTQTPWLIVQFHSPIYHTYYTHYKEQASRLARAHTHTHTRTHAHTHRYAITWSGRARSLTTTTAAAAAAAQSLSEVLCEDVQAALPPLQRSSDIDRDLYRYRDG